MNSPLGTPTDFADNDDMFYVLFAEGGGWPDHCVGPFRDHDTAEEYIASDKWRESWGSVSHDHRDLPIHVPNDECGRCGTPIFPDRHGTYIDMTGGDTCKNPHHHPRLAHVQPTPLRDADPGCSGPLPTPISAPAITPTHRSAAQGLSVLVVGNPADGFELIGPVYSDDPEMLRFAEDHGADWWLLTFTPLADAIAAGSPR